jgi:hypothetical protein
MCAQIARDQVCFLLGCRFLACAFAFPLFHFLFVHLNHLFVLDHQLCWFSFVAGEVISEKDKCGQCKGQKVVQDKKMLEVHVEKGMQHGQKITFQGEADEAVMILFKFQLFYA